MNKLSERMAFLAQVGITVGSGTVRVWASEADELEKQLESKQRTANRYQDEITALNERNVALNEALQDEQEEVETLKGQNVALNEALLGTQEASTLKGIVDHQTQVILDVRRQLDAEKQAHDICRGAVARRREDIKSLTDQLDSLREEQAAMQSRNNNQSRIIDDLKRQISKDAGVYLGRVDGPQAECTKLEKQRDEMRTALANATVRYAKAELQAKQVAAQTTAPTFTTVAKLNYDTLMALHDNQKQTIKKYQNKVRDLVERLEAERTKVGPVQDLYKDAKLEVRLLNDGVVEVLEYGAPGQHSRLRSTTEVVDLRIKVARREVELTRWQRSASVTEYDQWNGVLARYNRVPVRLN